MGFLDQKERILDIVLTDFGRELLSKNQLNFQYYAFSDEGIDYSGSLSASALISSSIDNYVHRDLAFEADQRKDRDLTSFLYTIPPGNKVLPEFRINTDLTASVDLKRRFEMRTIVTYDTKTTTIEKPVDIVIRATVPKITMTDRMEEYVNDQKTSLLIALLGEKK